MSERNVTQPAIPKLDGSSADDATDVKTSTLVERSVLAEGERSVAIERVEGSIINTGDVHINVEQQNIYNINPTAEDSAGTNIPSDFGAALSLVKLNQSLSSELARRVASELEEAREAFREGETREAFRRVQAIRASKNWPALDEPLRGLILRVLAHMTLSLKNRSGLAEARDYVDKAEQIDPDGDSLMINARLKFFEEGYDAALTEIGTPTTLDAFNLRVGLLIEKDEIEEALKELRRPPEGITLDAESYRLYALALLSARDPDGARREISKALVERPKRQIVRLGAAVIDYYSSLSPMALQPQLFPYPRPVHPSMVKRDADSQARLTRAAEEFERVANQMEHGSNSQKELKVWQIACTANIPGREPEAVELCKAVLSEDPSDSRVLSWVLYRNYDIDLAGSQAALEQALGEGEGSEDPFRLQEILTLIGIYLKGKMPDKVLSLLERHRQTFDASGHLDLWWYWRGQALIASGRGQTTLDESKNIQEPSLKGIVTASALADIGKSSDNYQPLIVYLEEAYAESKDGELLIQLCEVKAQTGDWKFAAAHAEEYCDLIGTASAAYFAISAAWNAQRPELCLKLLDKYEHLFPNNALPEDLRRLRVNCRLSSGDVGGALAEAEQLTRESDSVEHIFTLIDVLRAKGDFAGIEAAARRLRRREDVDASRLLRIAGLIKLEDPDLAREFWRRAKDEALNDPLLAAYALDLAFKLGLDHEVGALMGRMYELAQSGEGVFRMVSIEQMLDMMSENRKHLDQVHELYKKGEAPLSLVAHRTKRTLADIFHRLADENQAAGDPHTRPRILIRHGARLLPPPENFQHSDKWRLHLDVTALLLADHLGVLDKIEEAFKPLYVSGKISTALHTERNELLDSQQSRLDNYRTVIRLVEQGKLRVLGDSSSTDFLETIRGVLDDARNAEASVPTDAVGSGVASEGGGKSEPVAVEKSQSASDGEVEPDGESRHEAATPEELMTKLGDNRAAMISAAYEGDGFAVGFLPLQAYGQARQVPLELPTSLKNRVINCRSVGDSLLGHDHISEGTANQAVRALGQEANPNVSPLSPLAGAKLFLMGGVAELLAGAGVLERACKSFEVAVSAKCVEDARSALQEYERLAAIEERVRKLAKRISDGIEDGRYKFIRVSDARRSETDEVDESENPEFVSTLDLFRYEPVQWDILWIDDRAVNKHPFRDSAPIIGINEVLLALREREVIDKHIYYELLLKLRAQNFRYIPIDEDEIIYHLNKAQVKGNSVVESEALSVLRRYLASCLLDKDYFHNDPPPEGSPNPLGEWPFITQSIIATAGAIAAAWADERASEEMAGARADWILDNLYAGLFGCRHLKRDGGGEDDSLTLIAKDIASLMLKAIGVGGDLREPEQPNQRRKSYFSWLMGRVVYRRFRADPAALPTLAQEIHRILCDFGRAQFDAPQHKLASQLVLQRLYMDLPREIRREIKLNPATSEWLGLETVEVITVGGLNFKKEAFFKAVELALANAEAKISSHEPEKEFRFVTAEDSAGEQHDAGISPALVILDAQGNPASRFRDPMLGLLSPDPDVRLAVLEQLRPWFDCGQEDFEKEAREIVETSDPQQRFERARLWQRQSCEFFYEALERKFRLQEDVYTLDLTTPSARGLLRRFRLSPSFEGSFSTAWGRAAQSLLAAEGLAVALERAACLPVAMPDVLTDAFGALPQDERKALLQRLSSEMPSPLSRLHLVSLALRTAGDDEEINTLARSILADLYDDEGGAADFAAFEALLKFVNQEFGFLKGAEGWPPQTKLALVWAHATRLHSLFRVVGYSSGHLASFFEQQLSHVTAESLLREPDLWDDSVHPRRVNRTLFLTHAAAKAFAGIEVPTLDKAGAVRLIREKALVEVSGGQQFPDLMLLRDSTLYKDGLESLFGGDRSAALAPILGAESVEVLASENLKVIVEQALDELLKDQNYFSAWGQLFAILGGLPIYPELQEKCEAVVQAFDIEGIFTADPSNAQLALSVAAKQVRYIDDEALRSKFREIILLAVRLEVENPDANNDERSDSGDANSAANESPLSKRIAMLLDVVLILSIVPGDIGATGANIAAMMEKIVSVWDGFGEHFGDTMLDLALKLPASALTGWWPLLLRLRTSIKKGL